MERFADGVAASIDPVLGESAEDLYENAPCGYLSTLPDGTIVKVNGTFLRWTGYKSEELVRRKRFQDLLTPGGRIYHETHYAPLLRMQGNVREIAVEIVCADGRRLPSLVNSALRSDRDGRPAIVRTTVFDATERREYERELLRQRERAEQSEARARALARTLQRSFVPPAPPRIPGLDAAAVYRPAGHGDEVGGDFFDVFETARGDWGVVIGDVCGKGVEAAGVTALVRHTVRAAAMRTGRPRAVLAAVNQALSAQESDRFCTVLYARVRAATGAKVRLTIASGGHPLPIRVARDGETTTVGRPGTVLGVVSDPALHDASGELEAADVVAFYTDGVTEARGDGEFFGETRLESLLAECRAEPASAIAARVVDEVVSFQGGLPRDDIAVVVLKVPTGAPAA